MVINKYLLVIVNYDEESLESISLETLCEVHDYFMPEVADYIIKNRKYKGVFEEAILLEVDINSYFKGEGYEQKT